MSRTGFEKPAKTSNTPSGWRLDGNGQRIADDEGEAKTRRIADALAQVVANELKKGEHHEGQ